MLLFCLVFNAKLIGVDLRWGGWVVTSGAQGYCAWGSLPSVFSGPCQKRIGRFPYYIEMFCILSYLLNPEAFAWNHFVAYKQLI